MEPRRMPLEQIDVPDPCPAPWNEMSGDRRVRFCQHCRKNVYNLSAMPRDEAERLVCESAGSLCVRFYRDAAGRVLTLDYRRPAGPRRGWRYWTGVGALAAVVVGALNFALAARNRSPIGTTCVAGTAPAAWWPSTRPTTVPTVPTVPATTAPATQPADAGANAEPSPSAGTCANPND